MSILIENKKVKESTEKFENIIVKDISNNIFVVFSENEDQTKFKNDMCKLAQYYNLNSVLITDIIKETDNI